MLKTEIKPKISNDNRNLIIDEYETIIDDLQHELKTCKIVQLQLKNELEAVKEENKKTSVLIREEFNHASCVDCPGSNINTELIDNLKKQMTIIQFEKESIYQLWQMSLKAVDTLEEEIKLSKYNFNDKQVNTIKETYSEAIKALEEKLVQAKNNFIKYEKLWETGKLKIEELNNEKTNIEKKYKSLQDNLMKNNEDNQKIINNLQLELEKKENELLINKNSMKKLENDIIETKILAKKLTVKDQESKNKVAEAIELIETAMKEKESIAQREKILIDEKEKLEKQLTNLAETFAKRLENELEKSKDNYDKKINKYILEIKELKSELREKTTYLDRSQRECRLFEQELEKMNHGSDDFNEKTRLKVIELEEKLKEANEKLINNEEIYKKKIQDKIRLSDERIVELEERLASVNDRLRRNQSYTAREMEERVREADDRVKDVVDRCTGLDKRLTRALDERENTTSELRSLQITFDRETMRRENERRLLENRIRELQDNLKISNDTLEKSNDKINMLTNQIELLKTENIQNKNYINEINQSIDAEKSFNFKMIQEKYEERITELTKHVKIHQELSNKWKDEAEFLAEKFQTRYQELRLKSVNLQKENEELNRELLSCRQQVAMCRARIMQRCQTDESDR
ncbi:spindle pole body component 110-like isoform X2 [Aphidius gifuensis]|uniref:spindle pole body component 110-like isoform X2 n=1 Tax=Aphidius gifuensis TaxID=684658 RepID=UPI001CDD56F1|nr:spindle pole body component 110-like isoform X2 [Aphidius gifuensis]